MLLEITLIKNCKLSLLIIIVVVIVITMKYILSYSSINHLEVMLNLNEVLNLCSIFHQK